MANNVWDIKQNLRIDYFTAGAWTTIQADSYDVSIDRGINVEQGVFARPDVGTATVSMVKKSLSDLITGPAYKSNMPFRVSYQPAPDTSPSIYLTIFYGFIQNVGMSYLTDAKKLAITITANDTTKILCNTRLSSFSITGSSTNRGYRTVMDNLATAISAVDSRISLSQIGSTSGSTVQYAYTWLDVISGDILNQLLDAELGWCYSQRSGANQFYMTRGDVDALQATAWSSSNPTVSNIHTSSTNHYCMDSMNLSYDSDRIVNKVKVIETNSTPATDKTATNSTSVTTYGIQAGDFEINMDPGASPYTKMSDWATAVANAADPKSISGVSLPALRRDGTVSNVADIEIAYPLQVEFSDGTNTIQQVALVTRINHSITPEHWEVTLELWKGI
jgi:hypothetical protein